ncbi:MAG: polyhydroxyalkanoic acid system family protein [Byssovorax sp.]
MKHVIAHELDDATARKVVDRAFSTYKDRFSDYKPELVWAHDKRADISFNAKGIKLAGAMLVEPRAITLELDVPFLLRPFQKRAVEIIEREVQVWLGKARAGQI